MGKLYNENSIESLDPREFTRLKPGVYAGDTTYATQLLIEIVSNAIDEYRAGHGNIINIDINKDIIKVLDNGQGFITNSFREDGKTILEAAFSVLNTSGKYRSDGTYEGTSLGSFGIGSKITNFLSKFLDVKTVRDGCFEFIRFVDGLFYERHSGKTDEKSGTCVVWQPDPQFFTHTEVDIDYIKSLFKTISCLCPGLTITLNDNGNKIIYYSKNGINDLVDENTKGKEIIKNRLIYSYSEDKYKMDLVMTYTSNYSSTIVPYVNTGLTEAGSHITQFKTLITREMNKFFRDKKWIKDKEDNLTGDDIQEGMYLVFNLTAPDVGYDAQIKSRITKIDTKPFVNAFAEALNNWLVYNEKEIKIIADKALTARRAREAAKKAKDAIRDVNKKKKERVLKFDSKLADAWSKDRSKCEIIIVEGDSAAGNLKLARNNEFTAIMPIRGKLLNVRKSSLAQIQKNAEIMTIIEALGLSINTNTMKLTYNKEDLRYGKIIIMSDADVNKPAYERLFA